MHIAFRIHNLQLCIVDGSDVDKKRFLGAQCVVLYGILNEQLQRKRRNGAIKYGVRDVDFDVQALLKADAQQVIIRFHKLEFFLEGDISFMLRGEDELVRLGKPADELLGRLWIFVDER